MKLTAQPITVIVTEDGKRVLKLGALGLPDAHSIVVTAQESDDLGIWLRVGRPDEEHFFLLRWDYILAVDVPTGSAPPAGLMLVR